MSDSLRSLCSVNLPERQAAKKAEAEAKKEAETKAKEEQAAAEAKAAEEAKAKKEAEAKVCNLLMGLVTPQKRRRKIALNSSLKQIPSSSYHLKCLGGC